MAERSAREIRRIVAAWRARPLPEGRTEPWKIAVLVRARRGLARILPELRRVDDGGPIPYRAVEIDPLKERREVLDLLALTRALLHPADRVAWWAVLRAPWCGLTLVDLHLLAGRDDRAFAAWTVMELAVAHGQELPPDSIARLMRVWPVLEAAVRQRETVRTPELVERTWRSLGGDAWLKPKERENAEAFLRLLRTTDGERGEVELNELERRMEGLFAASSGDAAGVELLTIHKAKGLEWDAVIVPELGQRAPGTRSRLLEWEEVAGSEAGEIGVVLAPIEGKGEQSAALSSWVRGLRSRREATERRRLLYVAATRARMELHLFGVAQELKGGGVKAEVGSLLEAGWAAAERRRREEGEDAALAVPAAAMPSGERSADVLQFPAMAGARSGLSLAAGASEEVADGSAAAMQGSGQDGGARAVARPALLERLPLSFRAFAEPPLLVGGAEEAGVGGVSRAFARPEGSFAARSFGNAMHAFLEQAARRMGEGAAAEALRREVEQQWRPRVSAVLRGEGLAPRLVEAQAREVIEGLRRTLGEATGQWLLGARNEGRSELPLTVGGEEPRQYRMDRIFQAGAEPGIAEGDCLWIVDYKTSTPGGREVEAFLEGEKETYRGQMEAYARAVGESEVRVGLWFPRVGRLVWWVVRG